MSTNPTSTLRSSAEQTVRKFLFDRSFDETTASAKQDRKEPSKPATFTAEQLDVEKKLAYENGIKAGQQAMQDSQQKQMNGLLAQLDAKLAGLTSSNARFQEELIQHAREIAVAIARKILPAYVERYGIEEIDSIITKTLAERAREPRLVVRVGESRFDELSAKVNAMAEQSAYPGKVVVLADETMGLADCRVEWADGGIERDTAALWHAIETIMGMKDATTPDASSPIQNPGDNS